MLTLLITLTEQQMRVVPRLADEPDTYHLTEYRQVLHRLLEQDSCVLVVAAARQVAGGPMREYMVRYWFNGEFDHQDVLIASSDQAAIAAARTLARGQGAAA